MQPSLTLGSFRQSFPSTFGGITARKCSVPLELCRLGSTFEIKKKNITCSKHGLEIRNPRSFKSSKSVQSKSSSPQFSSTSPRVYWLSSTSIGNKQSSLVDGGLTTQKIESLYMGQFNGSRKVEIF